MAIGLTLALSVVATAVIGYALKATLGLRPSAEAEEQGLAPPRPATGGD